MVEYNSRVYIPYSSTTDIYNISFTYRHREEIFINIKSSDGITTEYLANTDWEFLNDSQVKLISKPSAGAIIEIYRLTNNTSREAKFAASDVSIGELDDSADQTFKIVQEAVDIANLSREESITTAIAAEQALINSEQALENSGAAANAASSAAESASAARNTAISAAESADQAVGDVAVAVAAIDAAVAAVADKVDRDGGNLDRLPFLASLGISPSGEIDFSDFALTSGSNIDTASYRSLLGIDDLENSAANTSGSNIDTAAYASLLGAELASTSGSSVTKMNYKIGLAPRVVTSLVTETGSYVGQTIVRSAGDDDDGVYYWTGTLWRLL